MPGDFMHITPKFIVDKINSVRKWGPLGKSNAYMYNNYDGVDFNFQN